MRSADAVVIGGGIGGLVAAHRLTQRGHAPVLLESRRSCGGLVFGAPIGGVRVDLGAESFARRSTATADLATELGLDIVLPGGQSWIWSHTPAPDSDDPGHAFRIPHGVLGIPTDLDDPEVRAALSPSGLERARMDLALPATVGADSANLADLVEARLGREVLDRLVVPIAGGVHSVHPSRLAVDVVTPGLRAALLEQGSLIAAAAHLRASAPPGPVVASVQGGLFRLTEALVSAIAADGGSIETGQVATGISRAEDGWVVTHADAGRAANPADPPVPAGEPQQVRTPRLIIALDGRAALDLLRTCPDLPVGDWTLPRGADLAQVCLVLNAPALDAAPRGSGLLVTPWMPGDPSARVSCKALTHYSVKWPDTVRGTGRHVVRVSYGRADEPAPEPTLEGALADASVILNCDLTPDQVSGHAIIRFPNSLPPQTPEHRERVAAFATVVADLPGLAVTGAWYAGTGLAAVVPHARASAERLA